MRIVKNSCFKYAYKHSKFRQGEAEAVALSGDWHVPHGPEASQTDGDQEVQSPEDGDLRHAYMLIYLHLFGALAIVDVHETTFHF